MATKPVNGGVTSGNNIFAPVAPKANEASEAAKAKAVTPPANGNATSADLKQRDASNVQISANAKERADAQKKAFDIAKATPEIREDKVQDIKARIANGTYQMDSGKIADSMLREAIMEHLAEADEN